MNPFGFIGERVRGVHYVERVFDAYVDINWDEVERRSPFGTPIVLDRFVLGCLSGLPFDHPVGLEALGPDVIAVLRSLPPGVVEFTSRGVVREWTPAISLNGAIVEAASLKAGITQVGILSAFAPRGVVVKSAGHPRSQSLRYAEELGIGVASQTRSNEKPSVVLAPAKRPVRIGTVYWRLLEAIFEHAIGSGVVCTGRTST